jgi:hypothetical protein
MVLSPLRKLVAKPTLTKVAKKKSAIKPAAVEKASAIKKEPAAPQITRASPAHAVCNLGFQTTRRITQLLRSGRPFLCVLVE